MLWNLRRSVAIVVLALVAACSGGGDDESRAPETGEPGSTADETPGTAAVDDDAAVAAAESFIEGLELDDAGRDSLTFVDTRRSPGVTHVRYRQVFDDVPVRAARLIVHVLDDGEVLGASSSLTDLRPEAGVEQQLDQAAATDVANKAISEPVELTASANEVWLPDGDTLRLGWSVRMATPNNSYVVWVDAVTGEVADARQTRLDSHAGTGGGEGCSLDDVDGPAACVFEPDPVAASVGAIDDADEADSFRRATPLLGLDDPESGALVGEFVNLESPDDSNPPVREEDGLWDQGRDDAGFEAAMAYVWIDRTQRLIQEVGFGNVRNESFPVVAVERSEVDNAFFTDALDTIFLGVGSNGIDAGEDARVIVHEYGHAVLHAQVPDFLFNEAVGGYHEAFGDALAFLVTLGLETDDPACLFPWFLGPLVGDGCGRRMDGDKSFPEDLVNEVHLDGEIWTGAIFDIVTGLLDGEGLTIEDCIGSDACDEVRDRVLATSVGANEFMTGAETFPDIARAYLAANTAQFGGADNDLIADAFAAHGLDGGGAGSLDPDGDPLGEAAELAAVIDITHSFRGDLSVEIGVVDAGFDLLCEVITVLSPSGDAADNVSGAIDLSGTECAAFSPPSADQQWVLRVVDNADADVGQINGFAVVVDGEPFLATGVPAPIADNDPTGTTVIVNGSGERVPQEGEEEPGDAGDGVPFASIAVSHTFVGDLQIRVGVADPAGEVLCSVPVLEPDPQEDGDDVEGEIDMSACAEFFPPSASAVWFLEVVDQVAVDSGSIDRFEVFAPDGTSVGAAAGVPIAIPDEDPAGAIATVGG